MTRRQRRGTAAFASMLAAAACGLGGAGDVPTLALRRAAFSRTVIAEGNLEPEQATPVTAPMEAEGQMRIAWLVPEGSRVRSGEVVVRFDPTEGRTLGEVQTVTAQSFVRIDESIRYLQEAMDQIFALRHEIWKMTLRDQGAIPLPPAVLSVLEGRGVHVEAKEVTAETLEGIFRGKPRGSVETADPNRRRADFTGFLQSMAQLAGVVPALQAYLGQPNVQQAILEQAMHVFNWRYRQGLVPQASALGFGRIPNLLGAGAGAPGMAPPPMLNPSGPGGPPA